MLEVEEFYNSQKEPNYSCLLALRDIISDFHPSIQHTVKYGMPCFVLEKKHFCYLWTDKETGHPYILIVDGSEIDHWALRTGTRKRMKVLPIDPNEDIPVQTIHEIFNLSLNFRNKSK